MVIFLAFFQWFVYQSIIVYNGFFYIWTIGLDGFSVVIILANP